jgi:spermidine/putrescine transport system permease protein
MSGGIQMTNFALRPSTENMQRLRQFFLLPAAVVMLALFFVPLAIVLFYSLLSRGAYGGVTWPLNADSYWRVFDPLYFTIAWRSFWIAALSTFLCLIFGFPLALYIARYSRRKTLLLNLVMLPFWTSFLIRTYAWMFLLRDTGLINTILQSLHVIEQPLPLLFNTGAVILGLVYGYLPFMVLPLYATIEKLDSAWLDAAADLGANPVVSIWKIIVPLSRPGIIAGSLLVFIPCLGAYPA